MIHKNMLLGRIKYLILFLIAVQSILFALMAIFFTGNRYEEAWKDYNRHSETVTVYLQRLTEEQSHDVFHYFQAQSDLSIWTHRMTNNNSDGGINRIYLDVLGNPAGFSDMINNGKLLVSRQQLSDLLSHPNNKVTIGLDQGSENMLYELPSLLFTIPVVIDRLDYVFQETNMINGSYHINGLQDEGLRETFLSDLSAITGISNEELTRESFGSNKVEGIAFIVLATSIVVNTMILLVLFLVCILKSFKHFGTLILLGWDRKELWSAFFKNALLFSIATAPLISLVLWFLSGWVTFGLSTFILIFAGTSFSIPLLCLTLIIPSIVVYLVSPLGAIHKRLPMKSLLAISLLFYTLVAALLIMVGHSLDAPMNEFIDNVKLAREWKNVEDMYVISSFVEGEDLGTYSGTTNSLESSMYRFYQRIAELPGVYVAQGTYHDQQYLGAVFGTYQHVPTKPFWYLTYSYNYLSQLGVELSHDELSEIRNGARLYLIPETLGEADIETMKAYLQELVNVKPGDIETKFTENPTFLFKIYQPSTSIFTWSTSVSQGVTSEEPIILVVSPENMYFMESANLYVSGYNGLLKIRDEETMEQVANILENEFPDLIDNEITFTTVKNYINGLQKDLSYTFYLFGSVIAIIMVTLIIIFWSFVLVYRLLFEEKLHVQYFMGFPSWRRYIGVFSLIIGISIIEFLASVLLGSKLGVVLTIATLAFQVMLLYVYLFSKEGKNILQSFKG